MIARLIFSAALALLAAGGGAWGQVPGIPIGVGSSTPSSSGVAAAGAPTGYINVMAPAYGAKGDTLSYADGTIATGTNVFTSASATFTAADVGKSIVVDYAGAAGAPLVTTIVGFTNANTVTLAANASTTVPYGFTWALIPSAAGTTYIPGQTITMAGGTFTAATVGTVAYTTVVSAVQNANGSGGSVNNGSNSGACQVQGTTGAGAAKFTLNVTLTAGAISAIGSFVYAGAYSTNPTSLTAEPVVPVNGCVGLAGATLTLTMGVLVAQPTTAGVYSVLPASFTQGATSGSGSGATFAFQSVTAGAFMYGTDDTAAWTAAINASQTINSAGASSCIYAPSGGYLITSSLPLWTTNGCIDGADRKKTFIFASPALTGDLFSWSEAWSKSNFSVNGSISHWTGQTSGPTLRNMSIVGDRTSANTQNAVALYDRNDYVLFEDLDIWSFTGSCLTTGTQKNAAQSYVRESDFRKLNLFYCGGASNPAMLFDSTGSGDATNEIRMDAIAIFAYFGHAAVFRSNGTPARDFYVSKLRIEGIQNDPVTIAADGLVIGDSTATGNINSFRCLDCSILSTYPGKSSIRVDANGSGNAPYYLVYNGRIGGGAPLGGGLLVNYGRDSDFYFYGMNTIGTNVTLASTAGGNLNLNAPGGAQAGYTYSISGGTLNFFPLLVGGPSANAYLSATQANSTVVGGNTPGIGAVSITPNRSNAYSVASGQQAVAIGGTNSQASGNRSAVIGGNNNIISGVGSSAVGGSLATDRGWFGARCHASGTLTDFSGDANFCEQVLRCQAAATNGSTCVATSDGSAAGAANILNIPAAAAYTIQLDCAAISRTTPGNNEAWPAWTMLLTRPTNAASTALSANTKPTPLTNGTVTGSNIAATADTTNGGLAVTFTSPSTNAALWDFTCHAQAHQVQ